VSEAADDDGVARKRRATILTATQCSYASMYYQYLQRVCRAPAALRTSCRHDVRW